jgi:DNA-binding phage protein
LSVSPASKPGIDFNHPRRVANLPKERQSKALKQTFAFEFLAVFQLLSYLVGTITMSGKIIATSSTEALEESFSRTPRLTGVPKRRLQQTIYDALKPENDPRFVSLCQNIAEIIHQAFPQFPREQIWRTLTKRGKPDFQDQAARSKRPTVGQSASEGQFGLLARP